MISDSHRYPHPFTHTAAHYDRLLRNCPGCLFASLSSTTTFFSLSFSLASPFVFSPSLSRSFFSRLSPTFSHMIAFFFPLSSPSSPPLPILPLFISVCSRSLLALPLYSLAIHVYIIYIYQYIYIHNI